jgi:putative membrane protein
MEHKVEQPSLIKELAMGFCLGTANIIPGVSGGTFLLVFKIYERVFSILNNMNRENLLVFFSCVMALVFKAGKARSWEGLMIFLRKNDFIFLLKLMIGALAAILLLSSLMKYLIGHHFSVTYALFFGLILTSIVIPVSMLTQKRPHLILFVLAGAIATIYVTIAVNPYDKVKMKSETYGALYVQDQSVKANKIKEEPRETGRFSFTGKYTRQDYLYAFLCGAVAISAMVLPGISGSLVLILMGEYFEVVSAISGLGALHLDNFVFLGCFSIGIIFGGLLFARLVSAVLRRYYNATMAFLIGLMVGSLYALWPFKKSVIMAEQYIKTEGVIHMVRNVSITTNLNQLPGMGTTLYLSILSFVVGCIIMYFFVEKEKK